MGTNNFVDRGQIATAKKIRPSHVTQLMDALEGAQVGRLNGVQAPGQDLGTVTTPFGTAFVENLVSGGALVDFSQVRVSANRIISGRQRPLSTRADFISLANNSLTFKILGNETPLQLSIDGTSVTYDQDVEVTATADTATPTSRAARITGTASLPAGLARYIGDPDLVYSSGQVGELTIDRPGTQITSRVGQFSGFRFSTGYFFALIKTGTALAQVKRNYFYGVNSSPLASVQGGQIISITKTGWVFLSSNNLDAPDITYRTPFEGPVAPSGEAGDYWFDTLTKKWKQHDGSQFVEVSRMPVAIILVEGNAVVAYHCFDFHKVHSKVNEIELEVVGGTGTKIGIKRPGRVEIDSNTYYIERAEWDISQGSQVVDGTVTNGTTYYFYFSNVLRPYISPTRPLYDSRRGYYHPFENWRCFGRALYASSEFDASAGANLYLWQKYSPRGRIDQEYSFLYRREANRAVTPLAPTGIVPIAVFTLQDVGAAQYTFTVISGLFTDYFVDSSSPTTNVTGGRTSRTFVLDFPNNQVAPLFRVTLIRAGNDFLQTKLDNTLK